MRVKVAVNVGKPLVKTLKIMVGGKHLWLSVKYEALPTYCFNCGRLGHALNFCDEADHSEELNPQDLPFGPEIKASPFKKSGSWVPRENNSKPPHESPLDLTVLCPLLLDPHVTTSRL